MSLPERLLLAWAVVTALILLVACVRRSNAPDVEERPDIAPDGRQEGDRAPSDAEMPTQKKNAVEGV